jgi:hypothetical protein
MLDREKEAQSNQLLNIIKIASLSFPAIAFLQYFFLSLSVTIHISWKPA